MKKLIALFLGVVMIFSFAACGDGSIDSLPGNMTPPDDSGADAGADFGANGKILVAYFSKTNTTESVAKEIRSLTGADIFEIERKEPYPNEYTPTTEVAKAEKEKDSRPELKTYLSKEEIAEYDVIFLGFPIWWGTAPMPVLSFLNAYDLSGKTIYTFCTAASSPISGSMADIRSNAGGATVIEGKRFTRNDTDGIRTWVKSLNFATSPAGAE